MDVDEAVFAGAVRGFLSVEPEDAGEDEILFLRGIGGLPDASGGFTPDELGAGSGAIADLFADAVPAEGGFITFGLRADALFGGGDGKGSGDAAVVTDEVKALGGYGNAEVHVVSLS